MCPPQTHINAKVEIIPDGASGIFSFLTQIVYTTIIFSKFMATKILNQEEFFKCIDEKIQNHEIHNDSILSTACENFVLYLDWYGKEGVKRLITNFDEHFLKYSQRHECIIGHFRNDEYYVFGQFDNDDLDDIFQELQTGLYELEDAVPFRIDIGVYPIPDDTELDAELCCNRAMLAGLTASQNDDKIHIFQDGVLLDMKNQLQQTGDVKKAIEENQFVVYFMPKVNSVTGSVVGLEALIRWNHPTKGIITPDVFIPSLENDNVITKLDFYVWECVCKEIKKWADEGNVVVPVSMNVSMADIHTIDVAKAIIDLVNKYELDPNWLHVEITETVVAKNIDSVLEMIEKLHEANIKVEMDDFGSGFSSLNMLKEIPVDYIKTDMALIDFTEKNHDKAKRIVQSVIQMAHLLDVPIIAEGVETQEQVSFLQTLDCVYMQGYFFSEPLSYEETKAYVTSKEIGQIEKYDNASLAVSPTLTNMELSELVQAFDIVADFTTALGLLNLNTGEYKIIKKNRSVDKAYAGSIINIEEWRDMLIDMDIIHSNSKDIAINSLSLDVLRKKLFYAHEPFIFSLYKNIDGAFKWVTEEIIPCHNCCENNPWCTLIEVDSGLRPSDAQNHDHNYDADIDPLTKAFTRGKYEKDIHTFIYAGFKSVTCVYIDVVGLHEINNYTGHQAGDDMLITVAKEAQNLFMESFVYRIGGDEFVILSPDVSLEETQIKVDKLKKVLAKDEYYISTGVSYTTDIANMNEMINQAELRMREAKQTFYNENPDRQERGLNAKLERILKQNEKLTDVLESLKFRYAGIYFVDTKKDQIQTILTTPEIKRLISDNNRRFYQTMNSYIHQKVEGFYVTSFQKLLDASYVSQQVNENGKIEFDFTTKSGGKGKLTIYRNRDKEDEYIWIFARV